MNLKLSKYWIVGIIIAAIAAFGIGATIGPAVTAATLPIPANPEHVAHEQELKELSQAVADIRNEMKQIDSRISTMNTAGVTSNDISKLETAIKVVGARVDMLSNLEGMINAVGSRVDKLSTLPNDIDELRKDIDSLKKPAVSQSLSADLNRFEFRPGDSMTVTGVGLPNASVRIYLLDPTGDLTSSGSTVSDSNGKFSFTMPLSRNLVSGTYVVKVTQDSKSIDRMLRIVSGTIQSVEGLNITIDRTSYLRGDTVVLSGSTFANTWVGIDVFDSAGTKILSTSTKSDSTGRYVYQFSIPSNALLGNYQGKATVGSREVSLIFPVVSSGTSLSGSLTIVADKSTYNRGDLVTITGMGRPDEKVIVLVEPPSGEDLILTTKCDALGKYRTAFAVKLDTSVGTWALTAKQGSDIVTASLRVV